MKNKKSLKVMLLAALAATTLLLTGCGKTTYTGRKKIFNPGEHSIVVNLGFKFETKNYELENHPGYITESVESDDWRWMVLYRNTEPVECVETDRGFTEFGVPIEEEVSMRLTKEE